MQRKNKDDFLILTFFVSFFVRDHWVNMYTLSFHGEAKKDSKLISQ